MMKKYIRKKLKIVFITIVILLLRVDETSNMNPEIVEDFFNNKGVVATTIFSCSINDYIDIFYKMVNNFKYFASGSSYLDEYTSLTELMNYPYYKLGVFLDFTCDFGKQVLLESSNSYLLNASYSWLIRINSTDALDDFENYNFGLDSDFTVIVDDSKDETITLLDLYKINSTSSLLSNTAGYYDNRFGLSLEMNGSIIQRRSDFKGYTFNSAIVTIDSNIEFFTNRVLETFVNNSINPESDALSRCAYTFCTYLMEMFNFTVRIQSSNSFGYPNQDGPILHDGLMGEVEKKAIDFGLSPVTIHIRTRMDVAHFPLCSLWEFRLMFIFCHPRTLGTYKALIIPFTMNVWIFTICLTLGIGVLLALIKYFSIGNPADTDKTLSGNIIITIGALYQQGLPSCSNKIPERIVLLFTLLIGVMIVTFYNSMIVTSLLQPPPKYINTPAQLLESSFQLILQNHSYPKNLFGRAKEPLLQEMYNKVKKGPGYLKPVDGVELIQKSKYAFFSEEPAVYRIIEKKFSNDEICSLQEIEMERPSHLYLPLKRNSPLREFFNHGFLLMRETGIIDALYKKWHPRKPICQGNLSIPSVELQSVLIAYIILSSGIAISIVLLLIENVYSKYKMKRNANTIKKKLKKITFNN